VATIFRVVRLRASRQTESQGGRGRLLCSFAQARATDATAFTAEYQASFIVGLVRNHLLGTGLVELRRQAFDCR